MVLSIRGGGTVDAGRAPGPRHERGSQVLEFAMVLPLFGIVLALLAQTGVLLADVVVVQGLAREVARTAAVEGVQPARRLAEELAGPRTLRVHIDDHDGLVEARAELETRAFAATGVELWLPAQATFRAEDGVPGVGGG